MRVARIVAAGCALLALTCHAEPEPATVIRSAPLDASRPYFVPTHPRVTTTVRFSHEIGAPDGSVSVFAEDAEKSNGAEYLVSWQQGDAYLTVTPLKDARMANLNVPYQGRTYVFYFYPVSDPLQAAASLSLEDPAGSAGHPATAIDAPPPTPAGPAVDVTRETEFARPYLVPVTPARLVGFLDRLKVVHAQPPGTQLAALASAMNVEVAISREELGAARPEHVFSASDGVAGELGRGTNDFGWFQIVLLRAVRDRRLNCIGFICLLRNTSDHVLAFDVNSFGARAGGEYLVQRVSDAASILQPHEQAPVYFVVEAPRNAPLLATNTWRLSVDLLSPRMNPGAAIARGFSPSAP